MEKSMWAQESRINSSLYDDLDARNIGLYEDLDTKQCAAPIFTQADIEFLANPATATEDTLHSSKWIHLKPQL